MRLILILYQVSGMAEGDQGYLIRRYSFLPSQHCLMKELALFRRTLGGVTGRIVSASHKVVPLPKP